MVTAGEIGGTLQTLENDNGSSNDEHSPSYVFCCSNPAPFMAGWREVEKSKEFKPYSNETVLGAFPTLPELPPRKSAFVVCQDLKAAGEFITEYLRWGAPAIDTAISGQTAYLLIQEPLIWFVKDKAETNPDIRVYWSYSDSADIYFQHGQLPAEIGHPLPEGLFLVDAYMHCEYLSGLSWFPVERFISVQPPRKPESVDGDQEFSLNVSLELIPSAIEREVDLIHVTDTTSILKAAGRYSWDLLEEIDYLPGTEGSVYLVRREESSLWKHFAGLFPGYAYLHLRPSSAFDIVLPQGTRLVPQLGSGRLSNLIGDWGVTKNALVLLLPGDSGGVQVRYLEAEPEPLTALLPVLETGLERVKAEDDAIRKVLNRFIQKNPPLITIKEEQKNQSSRKEKASSERAGAVNIDDGEVPAAVDDLSGAKSEELEHSRQDQPVQDEPGGPDAASDSTSHRHSNEEASSGLPKPFREALELGEKELTSRYEQLLSDAGDQLESADYWRNMSAVLYALKKEQAGRIAWAQHSLMQPPSLWKTFYNHPDLDASDPSQTFEERYSAIENRQLPGELHYLEVILAALETDAGESFMIEQKALYQDYFQGKRHPMGTVFREIGDQTAFDAEWSERSEDQWDTVQRSAGEGAEPLVRFIKNGVLNICGISTDATEALSDIPDNQADIVSVLQSWADGKADASNGFTPLLEVLQRIQDSGSRPADPESFLFFLPEGIPFEQILKRYQGRIQEGIGAREDFFRNERNNIQRIINNQILYDLCRNFGVLQEFQSLIPELTMPDDDADSLELTILLQTIKLRHMFGTKQGKVEDEAVMTAVLQQLPDPGTTQGLQPWNYLLSLLWNYPEENRMQYIEILGRKLETFPAAESERPLVHRLRIISILLAVLLFSRASADVRSKQLELRRKSFWVQTARRLEKMGFKKIQKQFNEVHT